MKINLQSLVFPGGKQPEGAAPLCGNFEKVTLNKGKVELRAGESLDLYSYFNIFNETKWRKYTEIGDLFFFLKFQGKVLVRILEGGAPRYSSFLFAENLEEQEVPLGRGQGILSISIEAEENSIVAGGGFRSGPGGMAPREDRISIVICTYNRQEYLAPNLRLLEQEMPPRWDVLIVDNGRSLDRSLCRSFDKRFRFFPNPNTGGSGGFTRGIIEVLKTGGSDAVLLMDDDVVIEPEALKRTAAFFGLLKEQYRRHFMAGAMLQLDKPGIQQEAGAVWNGVRVRPLRNNLDLAGEEGFLRNEKENEERHQFAGWWYCLVPLEEGMTEDLPWPFFLNGDDIEYSLRRARGILTLNGVCVWHEPFSKKFDPVRKHYLIKRNCLAANAIHGYALGRTLIFLFLRWGLLLFKRDKKGIYLLKRSVEDLVRGPEFLFTLDTVPYLAELRRAEPERGLFSGFFRAVWKLAEEYGRLQNRYQVFRPKLKDWEEYLQRIERGEK